MTEVKTATSGSICIQDKRSAAPLYQSLPLRLVLNNAVAY